VAVEKKTEKMPKKEKREQKPYRNLRSCPKCGPGVRLAEHRDRLSCGRCGYMEKKE